MFHRIEVGRSIERYVVEGAIGEGGMATVYLLRHKHLGTLHALKVLASLGPGAEVRLMLEGRVQAALRHPNVVAVTDILEVDGAPGLLMEYVEPPSLAVWLQRHAASAEEAESLFRGIVEGVRHAHRYGLVHRDLKPGNVLLAQYEGGGMVPKVADFGLAKLLSDDPSAGQTRSGLTMGTPQYMAPEQFRDAKKVDRRADIFSLGCILYELLSGRPPFAWSDFITLYNQIQARDYPPLPDTVPLRLREAVDSCLEPERDVRCPDCDSLLSLLDGTGLPTSPTVTPENLGRLVDVPVLRDRGEQSRATDPKPPLVAPRDLPVPNSVTQAPGVMVDKPSTVVELVRVTAPTLAVGTTSLEDAPALGAAPRPVPMPAVRGSAPTMVPEQGLPSRGPESAEATEPPARARWPLLLAGGLVVAIGSAGAILGVQQLLSPDTVTSASTGEGSATPEVGAPGPGTGVGDAPSAVPEEVPAATAAVAPPPSGEPAATRAKTGAAAPAGGESMSKRPEPAPKPVESTKPAEVAPQAPEPEVKPVAPVALAPAAVPTPAPVETASVATAKLVGDATKVEAVSGSSRFSLPGSLPPGTYALYAWFPGLDRTKAGTLKLAAGDSVTVSCTASFVSCRVR